MQLINLSESVECDWVDLFKKHVTYEYIETLRFFLHAYSFVKDIIGVSWILFILFKYQVMWMNVNAFIGYCDKNVVFVGNLTITYEYICHLK